jgi:hypothetical protein
MRLDVYSGKAGRRVELSGASTDDTAAAIVRYEGPFTGISGMSADPRLVAIARDTRIAHAHGWTPI